MEEDNSINSGGDSGGEENKESTADSSSEQKKALEPNLELRYKKLRTQYEKKESEFAMQQKALQELQDQIAKISQEKESIQKSFSQDLTLLKNGIDDSDLQTLAKLKFSQQSEVEDFSEFIQNLKETSSLFSKSANIKNNIEQAAESEVVENIAKTAAKSINSNSVNTQKTLTGPLDAQGISKMSKEEFKANKARILAELFGKN